MNSTERARELITKLSVSDLAEINGGALHIRRLPMVRQALGREVTLGLINAAAVAALSAVVACTWIPYRVQVRCFDSNRRDRPRVFSRNGDCHGAFYCSMTVKSFHCRSNTDLTCNVRKSNMECLWGGECTHTNERNQVGPDVRLPVPSVSTGGHRKKLNELIEGGIKRRRALLLSREKRLWSDKEERATQ